MNGKEKTKMVAISLVIVSFIGAVLLASQTNEPKFISRTIRVLLNWFFAFHLIKGARWARLTIGILYIIGFVGCVVAYTVMINVDGGLGFFSILMALHAIYYGWVVYMLLFDEDIKYYFSS